MDDKLRWILPVPFLIFGAGVWLYFQTENEVRVQMERAQNQWREENHMKAVTLYESIYGNYPKSRYADDALWEIGTIYYVNFHNVERALIYFRKLVTEYPDSHLSADAYLKLAEIHEVELGDLTQALDYLGHIQIIDTSPELHRRVLFKMGDAYLQLNQFDEALGKFGLLIEEGIADHLVEQARARVGTILQIQSEYEKSVECFQEVLDRTSCADCRLGARLGLIESYEFLGELTKAIEIAQAIPTSEYPPQMKEDLLQRLGDKAQYYAPPFWNGR